MMTLKDQNLYVEDKRVAMGKGDVILFPSNFMFPHRVTDCLKGERISFVGWGY